MLKQINKYKKLKITKINPFIKTPKLEIKYQIFNSNRTSIKIIKINKRELII